MLTISEVRNLSDRLTSAHTVLVDATKEALAASEAVLIAKLTLKDAEQRILNDNAADPKALGSNEATRAARIAELTTGEREDLFNAEREDRRLKGARDVAQLRVQAIQDELRAFELLPKAGV